MEEVEKSIYVVDDEKVISQTLATILNKAGLKTRAFEDPLAALEAAKVAPPALLITDVVMPGMTGVDLAIEIRKLNPSCKALLFSGQAATAALLEEARSQGYEFEFLAKPVHPTDLLAKLEPLLRRDSTTVS